MQLNINDNLYTAIDALEKITIPDSFVVPQNKIGHGNGEAKLYVGYENEALVDFFGQVDFRAQCFLLQKDLAHYLEETKVEYQNPEQAYIHREEMPRFWRERKEEINSLPPILSFEITRQAQIAGPRVYIKSIDRNWKFIRELSLPNITYISIVKLVSDNNNVLYYFKLFADYFGEVEHPYIVKQAEEEVESQPEADNLSRARKGQGEYRKQLLHQCPYCPITMVSDERVLIASHIKPWAKSTNEEKIDPYNGFMLTPTFDYLFDRGFLSFTDDKRTILSPFLSKMTYAKLGISDHKIIPYLPIEGREDYLKYHRENIFQGFV